MSPCRKAVWAIAMAALAATASGAAPASGQAGSGVSLSLDLPDGFHVADSTLLAGHLESPSATWRDPVFAEAGATSLAAGNLTVCPFAAPRSMVLSLLATVRPGCPQGKLFRNARLAFGPGTSLQWRGAYAIGAWPAASLASLYTGNDTVALLPSADGIGLRAPEDGSRFAPLGRAASVGVVEGTGTSWFNGTGYAFFFDGARFTMQAAGGMGSMPGVLDLALGPADPRALADCLHPFTLLDLEDGLLGPDGRESRANVSGLLYEYGRVPESVNGALVGRLAGQAGSVALGGSGVSLVRGTAFALERSSRHVSGTYSPGLVIAEAGVAIGRSGLNGPPWIAGILLWVAAAAVATVRRLGPARPWPFRLLWWGAGALAVLGVDLLVVDPHLGASALDPATGASAGSVMALAVFEVLAVALAFLLVALPSRIVAGRLAPHRWLWWCEAAVAGAWLLFLLLFPASVLALGHAVARL